MPLLSRNPVLFSAEPFIVFEKSSMLRTKLHLTVAAVVFCQGRYLMVEEIDKHTGRRVINQPAGHVEENEDLIAAVKRELFEETGLRAIPTAWLGISQLHAANGEFYFRVNFLFELSELPQAHEPQDPDILALHWFSAEQLQEQPLRSQLVITAVQNHQTNPPLPLHMISPMVSAFHASASN